MPFCVPVSEVFRCCEASLLPLVDAVVYKDPTAVDSGYEDRVKMLESSLNLVAADFPEQAEASGFAAAISSVTQKRTSATTLRSSVRPARSAPSRRCGRT